MSRSKGHYDTLNVLSIASPQFKPIVDEFHARLPNKLHAEVADLTDRAHLLDQVRQADVIFGEPLLIKELMNEASRLKLVQLIMAGVDKAMQFTDVTMTPYIVCRAGGDSFGPHMAEFVIGQILLNERHFDHWMKMHENHQWKNNPLYTYRSLEGLTVGILGGSGSIGQHIAKVCSSFGMKCRGLSSKAPTTSKGEGELSTSMSGIKAIGAINRSQRIPPEFFHDLDYLVNVMPSTAATCGMLGGDVLSACRTSQSSPRTVFINIGRGDILSDEATLRALLGSKHSEVLAGFASSPNQTIPGADRYLAAAVLDVFNTEPLPATHPLYSIPPPFLRILPHISGMSTAAKKQIVDLFLENINRFQRNEQLLLFGRSQERLLSYCSIV